MRAVQPQLHDDGLGLFAFEHVVAEPVGSDDNAEKLSLPIYLQCVKSKQSFFCQNDNLEDSLGLRHCTVWKFHDFSVTQILREINFRECRSSKNAIFNTFGGSGF